MTKIIKYKELRDKFKQAHLAYQYGNGSIREYNTTLRELQEHLTKVGNMNSIYQTFKEL